MAESIHVRGEGGTVIKMDLPLSEPIAQRLAKGHLRRVAPDGSPYTEPAAEDAPADPRPARPAESARKAEWVGYAVHALGLAPDEAEAMTRQDLIDLAGTPE